MYMCIDMSKFQLRNLENKDFYEGMSIGINACLIIYSISAIYLGYNYHILIMKK